jgi:hypothetical protein
MIWFTWQRPKSLGVGFASKPGVARKKKFWETVGFQSQHLSKICKWSSDI